MADANVKEVKKMLKFLQNAQKQIYTGVGQTIGKACALIQRDAQESMRDTQIDTTKTYYTYNKSKAHHPSAEGFPPAVDTGTLRRSITYRVDETKLEGEVGSVITNPPYGAYLELGTTRDGRQLIRPRPWLQPAIDRNLDKIKDMFGDAIKVAIKQ